MKPRMPSRRRSGHPQRVRRGAAAVRPRRAGAHNFAQALARSAGHIDALGNHGNVLLKLNRPLEAVASYDAGLRPAPDQARLPPIVVLP
jgi:hypothetical protein